jgi:hypothetical protein
MAVPDPEHYANMLDAAAEMSRDWRRSPRLSWASGRPRFLAHASGSPGDDESRLAALIMTRALGRLG